MKRKTSFNEWLCWYFPNMTKSMMLTLFIFLISIIVVGFILLTQPDGRQKKLNSLIGKTTCKIISFQPKSTYTQSNSGNHEQTIGYTVQFSYWVDGVNYTSSEYLKNSFSNRKAIRAIQRYLNDNKQKVTIRYSISAPGLSMIDIN